MGFDPGALLRGGGAGMAGYTQGKIESEQRKQEAQRRALSDALLRSQIRGQESLVTSRREQALVDKQRAEDYGRNIDDIIANRGAADTPAAPTPAESRAAHSARLRLVGTRAAEMVRPDMNVYSGPTDDPESLNAHMAQLQQEFRDVARSELAAALYKAQDDYKREQRATASELRAANRPQSGGLSLSPAIEAELGAVRGGTPGTPTTAPPSASGAWLGGGDQSAKAQLEAAVRAAGRSPEETARALERIAEMSEQDAAARINR